MINSFWQILFCVPASSKFIEILSFVPGSSKSIVFNCIGVGIYLGAVGQQIPAFFLDLVLCLTQFFEALGAQIPKWVLDKLGWVEGLVREEYDVWIVLLLTN